MLDRFSSARVLVVDDSAANIALVRALLTRSGLRTVYSFTDPRQALDEMDDIDPDLVMLDLRMPGMDGYEMLARLSERSMGAYLPVLVLTADGGAEASKRALDLGARDFLTKPFDAVEVVLRVRNLLETRHLYQALRHHNLQLREELRGYQLLERAQRDARELEHDTIQRLIADNAMYMVFQPVLDLGREALVGVEALTRFPKGTPETWFSSAASVGLGPALELAAVRAALSALPDLPEGAFLAINVSPLTVLSGELDHVCQDQPCDRIVLELTEHVPVEDYDAVAAALAALRADGVRLAADDTGAGFAGFHHLLALNPDIVKLDISLTRGIDTDPARRALASALISFTDSTGRKLIAEGIETPEELDTLQELGAGWGQGYHLARPQPLGSFSCGGGLKVRGLRLVSPDGVSHRYG